MAISKLEVVIVTYNSAIEIGNLLRDIRTYSEKTLGQTIVVDNCSSDKTVEVIKKRFPQVRLIENKTNVGYSRAVNQAVRLIKSDFFFLINPDVRILKKSFWTKLLELIRTDDKI